jgi:large exoprotein involved in heme utilization and adhesion
MSGLSQIDATATSSLAGNVELNVSEVAFLQDSVISGLSADPENDGGNFIIQHPQALILQRSSILANSASGAGGNISISADAIVLDTSSTVEATGQVLTTGEILGNVVQLDSPVVVDAAAALDTRCSSQASERSSMIVHETPAGAVREPYLGTDAAVATAPCGK